MRYRWTCNDAFLVNDKVDKINDWLKQMKDERWISVLFACIGLTLWVWHSDLLPMPPDASAEPENIQNDPEDTKTVQGP